MKGYRESNSDPSHNSSTKRLNFNNSPKQISGSVSSEAEPSIGYTKHQKSAALWSGIWPPVLSIFGDLSSSRSKSEPTSCSGCIRKNLAGGKNYYDGWRAAVRRVMMNGGSMRRILGLNRTSISASKSDICFWVFVIGLLKKAMMRILRIQPRVRDLLHLLRISHHGFWSRIIKGFRLLGTRSTLVMLIGVVCFEVARCLLLRHFYSIS